MLAPTATVRPLLGLIALGLLFGVSPASAGPLVNNVSPRGLQAGATTTLTIEGAGLMPDASLLMTTPLVSQRVREGGNDRRLQIDVTLAPDTPPGIYPLRVATSGGVSGAVLVGIDGLAQLPFAERVSSLPVALSGNLGGAAIMRTSLSGKAGERLVVDVEARRLGSALNPVIRLYDARRVQLAWAQGDKQLTGDARLQVILPADGEYTVELHDRIYRGASPGFFRLKLGELNYADLVYPLALERGSKGVLEFVGGSLPAGTRTAVDSLSAVIAAPAPWPDVANLTGGRPWVVTSDVQEVIEPEEKSAELPAAAVPCGLNGRLLEPGEEDRFRLSVNPGMKLKLDVLADRVGSPLDGVLKVFNQQGGQLASSDDRADTIDPGLELTVPGGVSEIVVALGDLQGRGGPEYVYRIAAAPADQADFELSVKEDRFEVPRSGSQLVLLDVTRTNYAGPIQLAFENLPPGLALSPSEIPAGVSRALVSLVASESAPVQALTRLMGESAAGEKRLVRAALLPLTPALEHQPWLRGELAVAVTGPAPLQLAWDSGGDEALPLGGNLTARLNVVRAPEAKGAVRLSLVTSQIIPKKKENNQDVDDLARALRLEGTPTIAADQNQAEVTVLVPADLAAIPYDLAFKAELLAEDGQRVLSTAVTPSRRLRPVQPPAEQPLAVFEDQPEFVANLSQGGGQAELFSEQKFSGSASVKVTPDQRYNPALPGLGIRIRENPGPGEYRYLRFAWKKQGGQSICLQLNHDGKWGPSDGKPAKFRYHAGPGPECYGASEKVADQLPSDFVVVTRDLFADFGEFTLTGLALSPVDGEFALFDHIYLGRTPADFERVAPKK